MARPLKDIIGVETGWMTVLERLPDGKSIKCLCRCGTVKNIRLSNRTHTFHCGCQRAAKARTRRTTHGQSKTFLYSTWRSILTRCNNPNHPSYKNHGAYGIKCEFKDFEDFAAAVAELGPRPSPKHTIDRIEYLDNYRRGNLRWLDKKGQAHNRRNRKNKQERADEELAIAALMQHLRDCGLEQP